MTLPFDVKDIIRKYERKFPVPRTNEEDAQTWTHNLCQQLVYSFPGDGWMHKSAGGGRPHSKDCIAVKQGALFYGWDIVTNAGSAAAALDLNGESQDLSGQEPEPVMPRNYLEDEPPPPPTDLEDRVARLEQAVRAAAAALGTV